MSQRLRSSAPAFPRRRFLALVSCFAAFLAGAGSLGAESLYWTSVNDDSGHGIRRSALDGSDMKEVVKDIADDVLGLAVDAAAGTMYWIERGTTGSRIVRADLDGHTPEPIHSTDDTLSRLELDPAGRAIYFTASGPVGKAGIRRLALEDRSVKEVIPAEVVDLAVDGAGGRIYWVQEGKPGINGTDIWSALLNGSDPQPIIHHPFEHHTTGIALDAAAGKIYWATIDYRDTHSQIVSRANLDGSGVEPLTTADPGLDDWPVFIDLDLQGRTIYWVNGEDGVFYRVGFDGGLAEELHEDPGPYGPFDMAVVAEGPASRPFRRGDADGNGAVEVTDPIATLGALFLGTGSIPCADAADVNDDGAVDVSDAVASLTYQFLGGIAIPPPGPIACGVDATEDDPLGCDGYGTCGI